MAVTPSSMLALGTRAPDFTLPNVIDDQSISLKSLAPKAGLVIVFMCNHCPFVKHILNQFLKVTALYQKKGFEFVAINANDTAAYPEDAPEKMRDLAISQQFSFPYLFDETQQIAKAYQAACTPDFFLFDKNLQCVYRGRFDGATPGNKIPVTGTDLCAALDALIQNTPINPEQYPSMGCNIKWKK